MIATVVYLVMFNGGDWYESDSLLSIHTSEQLANDAIPEWMKRKNERDKDKFHVEKWDVMG